MHKIDIPAIYQVSYIPGFIYHLPKEAFFVANPQIKAIVTRNIKDYKKSSIAVFSHDTFLKISLKIQ